MPPTLTRQNSILLELDLCCHSSFPLVTKMSRLKSDHCYVTDAQVTEGTKITTNKGYSRISHPMMSPQEFVVIGNGRENP
jgi:hypothetical protein